MGDQSAASDGRLPWRSLLLVVPLLWAPLLMWWLAFFPALSTADSRNSWGQIRTGRWTSHHPPPFTALLWLFTRFTSSPWVMPLVHDTAMAVALAVFAVVLSRRFAAGWWPVWAVFALVALPWIGPFTQEIWKDVPSTIALVVLATALILATSTTGDRPRLPAWGWTAIVAASALAAGLLRWNGAGTVWVAAVLAAPALAPGLRLRGVAACLVGGALGLVVLVMLPSVTAVQPLTLADTRLPFYTDVAVSALRHPDHFTAADRAELERFAPFPAWRSAGGQCWWINNVARFVARHDEQTLARADPALMATWRQLLRRHPTDIVWARLCRASAALPRIPPQHLRYQRLTVPDQQQLTPSATPPLPWLHAAAVRALDYFTTPPRLWILWMPAPWLLLFALAAGFFWRGLGRRLLLVCLAVPLGTITSYVVTAESNDARYTLPATIILVALTAAVAGHGLRRPGAGP